MKPVMDEVGIHNRFSCYLLEFNSDFVMDGKLLRLLLSVPSGSDFKYSDSFRWAIPTPFISPFIFS